MRAITPTSGLHNGKNRFSAEGMARRFNTGASKEIQWLPPKLISLTPKTQTRTQTLNSEQGVGCCSQHSK